MLASPLFRGQWVFVVGGGASIYFSQAKPLQIHSCAGKACTS